MDNTKLEKMFFIQYWIMFALIVVVAGYGAYTLINTNNTPVPEITQEAAVAKVDHQLECLAYNVFHEARSETHLGQEAVAWVTLNRVESKRYPGNICDVVKQPKQFSWYKGAKSLAINWRDPIEVKAWNKAKKVAAKVIADFTNDKKDPTHGALFYHTDQVNPSWADPQYHTVTIGDHIFYKKAAKVVVSR